MVPSWIPDLTTRFDQARPAPHPHTFSTQPRAQRQGPRAPRPAELGAPRRQGGAPAGPDGPPRAAPQPRAFADPRRPGTHTRTRAPPPRASWALRSYLRGPRGAPAALRRRCARPPTPRLGKVPSPRPGSRGSPGSAPGGGAAAAPAARPGVRPQPRGAHRAAGGAGAGARRPGQARGLLRGSGRPARARMAPGGPGPGLLSRPARRVTGWGQRAARAGQPAAESRARSSRSPARGAQQAGRTGGDCAHPGDGGAGPGRGAAGGCGGRERAWERSQSSGTATSLGPGSRLPRWGRASRGCALEAAGRREPPAGLASPGPPELKVTAAPSGRAGANSVLAAPPGALGSPSPGLRLRSLWQGRGKVVPPLTDFLSWRVSA